jgi:hypothetical protein
MQTQARIDSKPLEKRRFRRVGIVLPGRFMLEDRREFPCRTIDVSAGGLALSAPVNGAIGSRIVAYIDTIGRFEGSVARSFAGGFAMTAEMSPARREKLVNQLTWLINRDLPGMPEDRRNERIVPRTLDTTIRLPSGANFTARIVDMSVWGAAVACAARAPVGAMLQIGQRPARVVRCYDEGMALEFALPLSYDVFDENVVL